MGDTFSVTDFIAHVPKEIAAQNLGITMEELAEFPKKEVYFGDVGYVPMGAGHYIKNNGSDICRILIGFNNGNYEAIDLLSGGLKSTPKLNRYISLEYSLKFWDFLQIFGY